MFVATVELMDSLGLTVHPKKSIFTPCNLFDVCSETMAVRLMAERKDIYLLNLCYFRFDCLVQSKAKTGITYYPSKARTDIVSVQLIWTPHV